MGIAKPCLDMNSASHCLKHNTQRSPAWWEAQQHPNICLRLGHGESGSRAKTLSLRLQVPCHTSSSPVLTPFDPIESAFSGAKHGA